MAPSAHDWHRDTLPGIVRAMAARPRHEALRGHIAEILREHFRVPFEELNHEAYLLEGRGRIDVLWGATVIELKSNLTREIAAVHARLPEYLADAARRSPGAAPTGIATDGVDFIAFQLREGELVELARHRTNPEQPHDILAWLELLLSDKPDLAPEPRAIRQAFGRASLTFARARLALDALWQTLRTHPEVALKRDLWTRLLGEAYGEEVGDDTLFLQHTYLTTVVKSVAARVLGLPVGNPAALLAGRALQEEGIHGAVEADFFDWPLLRPEGETLVRQIAEQAARFNLAAVEADVLKVLYESLVDPDQRHDLGEYYTPDWLAHRVVAAAVEHPLEQRVLDPACGSGTFLFHAIRRLVAAGTAASWPPSQILEACAAQVRGLDVHPVAVTLARVTWLLALGPLIEHRAGPLTVPVFMGDAMQWNLRKYLDDADVVVEVPGGGGPLHIPAGFAENQEAFETGLDELNQGLARDATPQAVGAALRRIQGAAPKDADRLAETYGRLRALYKAGRNGIWTFVFRNLVRPVWLSRPEQRAHVLVGNPPWIVYRHLSPAMKDRVRDGLRAHNLWIGGHLATQQDMWALFWARGAQRYLAKGGTIAFVVPFAALNAPVFAPLRQGRLGETRIRLTNAWALEKVWPIFGSQTGVSTTSTCVIFGRQQMAEPPPAEIDRWEGHLPHRDAHEDEAAGCLTHTRAPWPRERTLIGASPYRQRFRNGASLFPRRFFLVEPEPVGRLGARRDAPRMRGRAGALDKQPWSQVEPPRGPIEIQFLRPVILGESIVPFRLLESPLGVVPLDGTDNLSARHAIERGYRHLADWLYDAETKWNATSNKDSNGVPRMTLAERADHMRNLSIQGGPPNIRVAYTKAGTRLSAAVIPADASVVDHMAYWAPVRSPAEADYLAAIINSEFVLVRVADLQVHGQKDKRHFDNLVWTLPIPEYDATDPLHRDLAAAAAQAEQVAAAVDLAPHNHFTAKRRAIREALAAHGIAAEIESLVAALLPG